MMQAAIENVPQDSWTYRALLRASELPRQDLESSLEAIDKSLVVHWWPWADLATEAVPVALAVFVASGGEFTKAVPAGIRMGRDADTIGAIVGSMAGAYGGENAIPEDWRNRVQASTGKCIGFIAGKRITDMADALAERAWEAING
jgi:hypothetical protein